MVGECRLYSASPNLGDLRATIWPSEPDHRVPPEYGRIPGYAQRTREVAMGLADPWWGPAYESTGDFPADFAFARPGALVAVSERFRSALGRMKRYRKKRTGQAVRFSASHPNHVWCLDFVFDSCLNGTKLEILAVKDEFTKECLALEVGTSFRSLEARAALQACFAEHGNPEFLRSDNGSELISRTLAAFLSGADTRAHFIAPGSPWQNGHVESLNSRLRAELLDVERFHNLADARLRLGVYRRRYNQERPHSALGYATPEEALARFLGSTRATPSQSPETGVSSSSSL